MVSPKFYNIRYVLHWGPVTKISGESLQSDFRFWIGTACFDNPKSYLSTPFLELLKWVLAELFSFAFPRNPVLVFSLGTRLLMAFPALWNLSSGCIGTCCYLESWYHHYNADSKAILSLLNILFLLDSMIFSNINDVWPHDSFSMQKRGAWEKTSSSIPWYCWYYRKLELLGYYLQLSRWNCCELVAFRKK